MMDDKNKILEGEQIDNLEGTSPSGENGVQLNNSTVPTPEQVHEAETIVDNSQAPGSDEPPTVESNESDTPNPTETVDSAPAPTEISATEGTPVEGAPVEGTPTEEGNPTEEGTPTPEQPIAEEKTFTQSQVNELVGRTRMETREQTYRAVYGRYGVSDEAGMDELVGNGQRYETVRGEYDEAKKGWEQTDMARNAELAEVKEHVALLESGIDRARFDDAKAIIKAKGLEVSLENIQKELATHPEWKGAKVETPNPNFAPNPTAQPQMTPTPESTIKVLGNEGESLGGMSEEEYAMKNIFKL